jgi:Ca2+-binding RTX toxin-like protein
VLHDLALSNAQDAYPLDRYSIAGRVYAPELSLMSAAYAHTSYYLMSLGDHVFYIYLYDFLTGYAGKDILHGRAGSDSSIGGADDNILYRDDGDDGGATNNRLTGGKGEDVNYGGDGRDLIVASDGQRDKIYCGKGGDFFDADKIDYVSSSCEEKTMMMRID